MICFAGIYSKETDTRHVLKLHTTPALSDVSVLADSATPPNTYDWGPESTREARHRLAYLLLAQTAGPDRASRLFEQFSESVIQNRMHSGHFWLLGSHEIDTWVTAHEIIQ